MRRYLDMLFGNTKIKNDLGKSIESGTLHHAILLEGPSGSGKTTLALQIAAAELCENKNSSLPLPCGECRACRLVLSGNAADVAVISKGEKATLGVETVREAREDMFLQPTELPKKFYIFKDAHTMTPQAQNALLIVLEEPPKHVNILLLCEESEAMLLTIRSRTRLLRMELFSSDTLRRYFNEKEASLLHSFRDKPKELSAVFMAAGGRIGEAKRLLAPKPLQELLEKRELVEKILSESQAESSFSRLCDAFALLPTKREPLSQILSLLHLALRDCIVCKKAEGASLLYFASKEDAEGAMRRFSLSRLLSMADKVFSALDELERNANVQTVLTLLKCDLSH
ncbi:MAG: hypothetical protein J6K61_00075 [Clostridia bacterium]|nr:hypothetical protein [Clostridia bacterium]